MGYKKQAVLIWGGGGAVSLDRIRGSSRWKRMLLIGAGLGEDTAGTSGRTMPLRASIPVTPGPCGCVLPAALPILQPHGWATRDEGRNIPGFSTLCAGSAQPDAAACTISILSSAYVTSTPPLGQELRWGQGHQHRGYSTDSGWIDLGLGLTAPLVNDPRQVPSIPWTSVSSSIKLGEFYQTWMNEIMYRKCFS